MRLEGRSIADSSDFYAEGGGWPGLGVLALLCAAAIQCRWPHRWLIFTPPGLQESPVWKQVFLYYCCAEAEMDSGAMYCLSNHGDDMSNRLLRCVALEGLLKICLIQHLFAWEYRT